MTNSFKKIIIVGFVVFIVILFLAVGFIFFPKEKNRNILDRNNQQEERQTDNSGKETGLTEEEKVKAMAENFAIIYYSYAWGNFSNIESQYYYMTDEMKNREESRVEKMREETENQPQKYFTVRAKLTDSDFVYYEKERVAININLSVDNFAGAIVQRDTMVWVDERGNLYGEDLNDLITNTVKKNIEVVLVKVSNEWRMDEIREIKN